MKCVSAFLAFSFIIKVNHVFAQTTPSNANILVKKISTSELSVTVEGSERRCQTNQQIVDIKLSSDGKVVIISGTSYISTADLERCNSGVVVHAKEAAPHVGFLADVNLKSRVYASLVPVSVNPMSFLAFVGKIGSDRNLINRPGFYKAGVKQSTLLSEASSVISPTLSLDARYVSLDLHSCDSDGKDGIPVIEIRTGRKIELSRAMCEKNFHFQ